MKIRKHIGVFHAEYDTLTGLFTSLSTRRNGKVLGWRKDGYTMLCVNYKQIRAHKLAWFFVHGETPACDIDHINGNRSDNRIENLRLATRSQNMQNVKHAHKDNKTGLLGVSINQGKYFTARICHQGKVTNIGCYKTAEEAHKAYLAAKKNIHKFAN